MILNGKILKQEKASVSVKSFRPPDKSVYLKIIFLISQPKHMFWVLNETVLLSTQNIWAAPCDNVSSGD